MLRIAIASSGLGHIRRGVESWANDLAIALHSHGAHVSLFQAAGTPTEPWRHTLPCWRRFDPRLQSVLSVTKKVGGWRYGFGSPYQAEQTTFSFAVWRAVRAGFDILQVQDPWLARILDVLYTKGWSKARVILAHGTEEEDSELRKYRYLQHLAPCYQQDWETHKPTGQLSFGIPNFVDTTVFCPGDRNRARELWKIPQDALVVLCVAALKKHHKRCDYLVREFAEFRKVANGPVILVMAGAWEQETAEIAELGKSLLGDSLKMLQSVDRSKLPSLYQAADIFAIASLHEMMPIALLEALASGLPITCNRTPVLEWMAGAGGAPEDIAHPSGLVRQWQRLADPGTRSTYSIAARTHAERTFSTPVALRQILEMYTAVMRDKPASRP